MKTEYRNVRGFKAWFKRAREDLNDNFPMDFWVEKTRNGITQREGNIGYQTRRKVVARLSMKRRDDGSIYAFRNDPPADNRWRFAEKFHTKEGGKVIVDRCEEYLAALTKMIEDWENQPPPPPPSP
jgi:hypothetical protein